MNENEESEIMQDFGQILRTIMGSGMQAAEQTQRRAAMRAQEQAMNEAKERAVAQMIGKDFASDKFWRTAGSESIADRMTLSLELATKHGASSEAARAFMTGADRIRNQFGINVEDINRDHPTAATERHHALRDALDDYFAGQRANAESTSAQAQYGRDGSLAEAATTDPAGLHSENASEEVAEATRDEIAQLTQAERFEGEENLDRTNIEAAEGKETRTTQQVGGIREDAGKTPVNQQSDASQRILSVWREKFGGVNNPSLAQAPTLEHPKAAATPKRPKVLVGQGRGQGKEQGLSR